MSIIGELVGTHNKSLRVPRGYYPPNRCVIEKRYKINWVDGVWVWAAALFEPIPFTTNPSSSFSRPTL